jgi:hypothetical protein
MATPTGSSKGLFSCGLKQGSAWGTAVALGAGFELLVPDDGNPMLNQAYEHTDAMGRLLPRDGDLGECKPVEWDIHFDSKCGLQYAGGGITSLIGALFGTIEAPAVQDSSTAYMHSFKSADEETDFFTFATERSGAIREVPSAIVKKLTLKVGDGKVQGTVSMVGNTCTNAGTNTDTQMTALTPEAEANFVLFGTGVLRMNDQTGSPLSSGDSLDISDFTIDLERKVDAKMSLGGSYVAQPATGPLSATIKMTMSRATAAGMAYETDFTAMTAKKLDLIFTGGIANSTYHYKWTFIFPRMKFTKVPDSKLADNMVIDLELSSEEAASAPQGMTGYTRPGAELVNLRSTAYVS